MSESRSVMTRWGLIAAALGQAIGAGNIWRFPRKAAEWGGGSFLILYLLFNLLWAVPLLMSEMTLGKKTRKGTIGAFIDFVGEEFSWMGSWMAWVTLAIGFEYAVVTSWVLKYLVLALGGTFARPGVDTNAIWNTFMGNPAEKVFYFLVVILLAFMVVFFGVKVFELVAKLLVPSLVVLMAIVTAVAFTLPGVREGLYYLYVPKLSYLTNSRTWLEALTQVAWSTGAGWGFLLTFAVYSRKKEDIALNSFITVWGDMSVALLAATAIIITVFSFVPAGQVEGVLKASNTGFAFIYLTQLMSKMPLAYLVSVFFFLAFFFAAFTSLVPMFEVSITNFVLNGWDRKKVAAVFLIAAVFAGLPSALDVGFQDSQDFVWGLGLWLSGMFVTYAVWRFGVKNVREYINEVSDIKVGLWFDYAVKYIIPTMFVILLGWWIYQSLQWYEFDVVKIMSFDGKGYNLGTIIFWWVFALLLAFLSSSPLKRGDK